MRRVLFMASLFLATGLPIQSVFSQTAVIPRPSPLAIVNARYKEAYLKITYSQPHKKGREIFGTLVPFGKVWRTGANEATEMTITRDIEIGNKKLVAGTYSIFTIPEKNKWTVILNSDLGMWGSYNYNPDLDVMRLEVPVTIIGGETVYEPFTISLIQKNEMAELVMMWDRTRIAIPVKFIN